MTTLFHWPGNGLAPLVLVLVLALGAASPAPAQVDATAAQALAEKHMCLACHKIDAKSVGPSYRDVAAKYASDPAAAEKLIQKVTKGGKGVWGNVPMPPNKDVPVEDIKTIVVWVLSLAASPAAAR